MPPIESSPVTFNAHIRLEVINNGDSIPIRHFSISTRKGEMRVGRGSQNGAVELFPGPHNAWFESRVMSRNHAIIRADFQAREIYIEEQGSMHGTYLDGRKIKPLQAELLSPGQVIKFGAEVLRGPDTFPPLEVILSFKWQDEAEERDQTNPMLSNQASLLPPMEPALRYHFEESRNSFSVPDYAFESDEEEDEEEADIDEVEVIQESLHAPRPEVVIPPRTYTVPASDMSCAGSFTSDDAVTAEPATPELIFQTQMFPRKGLSTADPSHHNGDMPVSHVSGIPAASATAEDGSPEIGTVGRPTVPSSTTLTAPEANVEVIDCDFTESESEGEDDGPQYHVIDDSDDYSDDVADECLSDIDEEPTGGNVRKKLVEESPVNQHSDTIANPTQNSVQITVTAGENSPLAQPEVNDHYSASPGRGQNSGDLQAHAYNAGWRLPSPSDAAMAKSNSTVYSPCQLSEIPSASLAPPVLQITSDWQQPERAAANLYSSEHEMYNRYSPYDPAHSYGSFDMLPLHSLQQSTSNETMCFAPSSQPLSVPGQESQTNPSYSTFANIALLQQQQQMMIQRQKLLNAVQGQQTEKSTSGSTALPTFHTLTSSNKSKALSINDIVERDTPSSRQSSQSRGRKRKSDEMLVEPQYTDSTKQSPTAPEAVPVFESTVDMVNNGSVSPLSTLPNQSSEEPTPKRVRRARESGRSKVAKYAAAALAGVLIGGIGTVATLVALPVEFFV